MAELGKAQRWIESPGYRQVQAFSVYEHGDLQQGQYLGSVLKHVLS